MRLVPALRALGLLVSLGLPWSALALEAPLEDEAPRRLPQLAVEVGGFMSRMQHPSTLIPTSRQQTRTVESRNNAVRLTGGIHFNILRGSGRDDVWWINGIDWYFANAVDVLAFRPGLEKRLSLSRRLTLGVAAFGGAAEVSVPTGQINQNQPTDPGGGLSPGDNFYEGRARKWIFGAGGMASLQYSFGRIVYTRVQAGYTQYFQKADDFRVGSEGFSVSLSGPFAGALLGASF
ncbi:hypothetical protein [Myxococcus sp. RHSTA-1-4]|uniref:hypothetical protein n=1 Tax=Myxococcus sp. RHSTA-1-4 TaxID=2874601 RepID=UPI001CC03454|nr:hypothetical protein [Myxococcus sp. RHSTA-1-4]MBZ4421487.1 hypothetical protein [Myxococcus sp. RHSTA-1-4]